MKALENKIIAEGEILPGNVLKVGTFLNHQIDADFTMQMGKEIADIYNDVNATKILTIEASGIAIALAAAAQMHIPFVFAKKSKTANIGNDETYVSTVFSFTHKTTNNIVVNKDFLNSNDRIVIIDDFLADGNAINGLIDLVNQAGGTVVGITAAIEKGFQGGGDKLRAEGYNVNSLAVIDRMEDGNIVFRS